MQETISGWYISRSHTKNNERLSQVPPAISNAHVESKKWSANSTLGQLTLHKNPVPIGFSNLIAPKKHQVEQDQHRGRTRRQGSVEPAASLWGEVSGL